MAHTYAKAPPAYAKDPWAWDYTRDRMEQNTGLPYDQWQGKHFAGAAAMYKNVVKKYRDSILAQEFDVPRECVDCGGNNKHYKDDYVCTDCRDALEAAPSFEKAVTTISNPGALDAIREQLYESLGHAKKDASKAKAISNNDVAEYLAPKPGESQPGKVSRNYKAMGEDKLRRAIADLEAKSGDAYERTVAKGEDHMDHLEAALVAAQEKGIDL